MAARAERPALADRLLALVAVVVFWLGFGAIAGQMGRLPLIADTWAFPYQLERVGWQEILLYFDRQPPGFLAYVKALSLGPTPLLEAIVLGNAVMFTFVLYLSYFALLGPLGRLGAVAVSSWLATGLEFHLYVAFTRYEMLTAFLVVLLLTAHRLAHDGRRGRREWLLAAAAVAAATLALCRSFFFYFFVCYLLLSLGQSWRARRQGRLRGWRGVAVFTVLFVAYAAVPAVMLKNWWLYDHATVSAWGYESVQRAVRAQLKIHDIYQEDGDVPAFVAASPHLSDETKRVLALGARWPILRRELAAAIGRDDAYVKYLRELYPPEDHASWLYRDASSQNGYLFGRALRHGHEVALAILRQKGWWMLPSMVFTTSQLATCYSGYWFVPGYGRVNCRRTRPALLYDPQSELEGTASFEGYEDPGGYAAVRIAYHEVFPDPLLATHLALHRLIAIVVVCAAFVHLVVAGLRLARRRRLEQGPFLLAAVIAYGYLVSVFGEYGENMRFGIYWKVPAVWYACWLGRSALERWRRRRRRSEMASTAIHR